MNCYEKYYRRSYNMINRLIKVYKNGYNVQNTNQFRNELINKFCVNPIITSSEINSIMFTILIALLGLNKEAIENTGKIKEYKKANLEVDISAYPLNNEQINRVNDFNKKKIFSTDFDEWLSIEINPDSDKSNIDYLRRVRNALLHSNFYIDDETTFLPFTKLKTKSYYESEIFNLQFQMFVLEYFGNIEGLGLTESLYTFNIINLPIHNKKSLKRFLKLLTINEISYNDLETIGVDTPELILKDASSGSTIDVQKFVNNLKNSNNAKNIDWKTNFINNEFIEKIIKHIENKYGDNFYKFDHNTQTGIITTYIKYTLNPKIEISNWLSHFWYLFSTSVSNNFNMSFFDGDEFGIDSCYPALMILKSYLLIYRMQNNNFDEIDYSNVNFDINDKEIYMYSDVINNTVTKEDFFQKSFIKEKTKNVSSDDQYIWNKIICEVVRDSLAHGNIRTYVNPDTFESMIELKDIDSKKGTVRVIIFTLSKYEEFLNSEAFNPSYCYKKESDKALVKKV